MHRFFVSIALQQEILLPPGELYHQIAHVFRARVGDTIMLFSEGTDDHVYEICTISKKGITVSQKEIIPNQFPLPTAGLILFQAYPNKLSTLELLVQKCSELGVGKIIFWKSEYAQLQVISEAKKSRIEAIAREALEQCGANMLLQIEYSPHGLHGLLDLHSDFTHIVGHYDGNGLPNITQNTSIAFWVGPEGGWSIKEKQFFKEKKMFFWKFNNRILRLETAAIVGVGILLS